MGGESEGKSDAEIVLGHGFPLVGGVSLAIDLERAADLDEGRAGEGVVG